MKIPQDEWFQVVMVHTGPDTGLRVHVNGKVATDTSLSVRQFWMNSGRVVIGRRFVDKDEKYCSSTVDELMLWNRSLTTQETEYVMAMY